METMFVILLGVAVVLALVFGSMHFKRNRYYYEPLTAEEATVLLVTVVNQVIQNTEREKRLLIVNTYTKRLIVMMGKKNKTGQELLKQSYDKMILKLDEV